MPSPHPKYTPEELTIKINEYFNSLKGEEGENKPPTISGLAYWLGFASRQSIYDYKNNNKNKKSSYIIKRTILLIESHYETMLNKSQGAAGVIFWLKNHNWTDKQEVEHSGAVTIIDDIN